MQKTPKAKTIFRIERKTFEGSVFRGLKSLGAYPTGSRLRSALFDSTQWVHHMT